jgi:hypothetical protein
LKIRGLEKDKDVKGKGFDDPHRIQYINTQGNEKRFKTVGKVIKSS